MQLSGRACIFQVQGPGVYCDCDCCRHSSLVNLPNSAQVTFVLLLIILSQLCQKIQYSVQLCSGAYF